MIKKLSLLFFLGIVLALSSCESTGICTEPITPKLMIGFSKNDNLGNPEDTNPPSGLKIYGTKDGIDIVGQSEDNQFIYPDMSQVDKDKRVALLFDVNRDTLTYIFKFNENTSDTLQISYSRENKYVSKDCGYKTIFHQVDLDHYSTNAIDTIILLTEEIEYDTEQHIKIFSK